MYKCNFWNTIFVKFAPVHVLGAHFLEMVDKAGDGLCCRQEKGRATFPWPPLQIVWVNNGLILNYIFTPLIPCKSHLRLQCARFRAGLSDCTWWEKLLHPPKGRFHLLTSPPNLSVSYPGSLWYGLSVIRDCEKWIEKTTGWRAFTWMEMRSEERERAGLQEGPAQVPRIERHTYGPHWYSIHVLRCVHSLFTLPVL